MNTLFELPDAQPAHPATYTDALLSSFVRIVRDMQRGGTSRDKRPAGVSQPMWRKIMHTLEDLDGAVKGASGYELADDLDALLDDISRW